MLPFQFGVAISVSVDDVTISVDVSILGDVTISVDVATSADVTDVTDRLSWIEIALHTHLVSTSRFVGHYTESIE